jgi:DNA-binding response OmpR family regulator
MINILVIDDEHHIRKLYSEYLTREGYRIDTASGYDEALQLLKQESYDLILLDIELGETSGLDVLKKLKEAYPDIPIILNTGFSVYKTDFNTWLADGYVVKSSDLNVLKNKIQQVVEV